jgi:hypothetical protein
MMIFATAGTGEDIQIVWAQEYSNVSRLEQSSIFH